MLYVFSFIAGLFAANGLPHFISGITGKKFQTPFGNTSPVVNVIWGWINLVVALVLVHYAHPWAHIYRATACFFAAVLVMAIILSYVWNMPSKSKSDK